MTPNAADVTQTERLLQGSEVAVYAVAGYSGAEHRVERKDVSWHVAAKRAKVKAITNDVIREATQDLEILPARFQTLVEHPFHVLKRQFGFVKVQIRGLAKNAVQVLTFLALSDLWQARHRLLALTAEVSPAVTE
ncbi:MAG: transposase [Lysobacterales bacterium]